MLSVLRRWKGIWTALRYLVQNPLERLRAVLVDTRVRQDILYVNLAELARRHHAASIGLTASELRVFSQNGEDGVIAEVLRRIGTTNRFFVEFGIGGGVQGNCVFLADILGWAGVFMEANGALYSMLNDKYDRNDSVQLLSALVTADNINDLLRSAAVPPCPDIMSIDIDGNDYWVWEALVAIRPRLVIIEYNGSLDTKSRLVQPYEPFAAYDYTDYFGSSLGALVELGHKKGYQLIHTDLTGNNAFFVDGSLASRFSDAMPAPERQVNYQLQGRRHRRNRGSRPYLTLPPNSLP